MFTRLISVCVLFSVAMSAPADELRPTFDCLPRQTVLAVRAPAPKACLEQLRATTRFGRVVLQPERLAKLMAVWQAGEPEEYARWQADLKKVGLTEQDLHALGNGAVGYALTMWDQPDDDKPLTIGIAWVNPGREMAGKYIKAIERSIEAQANDPHPATLRRIDVAGHKVMHIADPVTDRQLDRAADAAGLAIPDPVDLDDEGNEVEPKNESPGIQVDQANSLIVRLGGRIVVAHTFAQNADRTYAAPDMDKVDFDRISNVDRVTEVFAGLLTAHRAADPGATFASRVMATPGLEAAMPAGPTLVEVYGDMWQVHQLARDQPEVAKGLKAAGVSESTVAAYRWSITDPGLRAGLFIAAPSPRQGLMTAIDQKPQKATVPAWVTADAMTYAHVAADMGPAWTSMKTSLTTDGDPTVTEALEQVEFNVKAFAMKDVAGVLSGLGARHAMVAYRPTMDPAADAEPKPKQLSRFALVWELADATTWQTIVQGMGPFAMMSQGKIVNHLDGPFMGFKTNFEDYEASLMLGRGHMVMGVGENVTPAVTAALADPPAEGRRLTATANYKRFMELLQPRDGVLFHYADAGQYVDLMSRNLFTMLEKAMARVGGEAEATMIANLKAAMPSPQQMRGTVGVGGGYAITTGHGLVGRAMLELPNAE